MCSGESAFCLFYFRGLMRLSVVCCFFVVEYGVLVFRGERVRIRGIRREGKFFLGWGDL